MTLIEIRPHPWGWKVFEAPGVEPVFHEKDGAIRYAEGRIYSSSDENRAHVAASSGNNPIPANRTRVRRTGGTSYGPRPTFARVLERLLSLYSSLFSLRSPESGL
jgi:hypothetical protein